MTSRVCIRALVAAVLVGTLASLTASTAAASSLVYVSNNNVWLANPDGSGQYQVTLDGTASDPYTWVSQANDGTIVAVHGSSEIVRMHQNGTLLNPAFSIPGLFGDVGNALVSPDGSKVAFDGGFGLGNCVVCGPMSPTPIYQVSYSDRYADPSVFRNGFSGTGYGQPSWLGNSRNLLVNGSGTIYLYDLGAPYSANTEPLLWLQEQDYEKQLYNTYSGATWPGFQANACCGVSFDGAAVSDDGTRLAVLIANSFASQYEIALFSDPAGDLATGNPPTLPTLDCFVYPPQGSNGEIGSNLASGSLFNVMSWSPDDSSLAYGYDSAIDVLSNLNLTNCTGTASQVIANGSDPSWGPANVDPGPRQCTGAGCNPPPPPPHCSTTGASLDRCLAKQTYQSALAGCNQKYAGSGRSKRTKRAACRRRATINYHRTLARINCSQITNGHKRMICLARARKVT